MEKGKIIVIEGTDCSGKETQSKKLIEKLENKGINSKYFSFPNYSSPTGKIVGYPYLGKPYLAEELINNHIDEVKKSIYNKYPNLDDEIFNNIIKEVITSISTGWFKEGAPHVDPKISALYYAADRAYNIPEITKIIEEGYSVILDRYVYSNIAHQGGKIEDEKLRREMYDWNTYLEFEMLNLPKPDIKLFLHMPIDYIDILKAGRSEALDENERDKNHLINAEKAFLEITELYNFTKIECANVTSNPTFSDIKTPDEISDEVYETVAKKLYLR